MELNGILIFHKPQDFTSHDVVAKLRGILRTRKIGHGGTRRHEQDLGAHHQGSGRIGHLRQVRRRRTPQSGRRKPVLRPGRGA